jgi:hypothetical protein
MKRLFRLFAVAGLVLPMSAWAQKPPGWQICWGNGCNVAVPLDPWMAVATGVLLLLAALTALRRRTRGGLFLLAGAVAVSAYALHEMKSAYALIADVVITDSSGNQTLACLFDMNKATVANGFGPGLYVLNSSGAPVTLHLVPLNGASLGWLSGIAEACQQGGVLDNNSTCFLPCTAPAPV